DGEVYPRVGRKRMIVAHDDQEQENPNRTAESGRRQRSLVDGDTEDFENRRTERDVSQNEQEFHQRSPAASLGSAASVLEREPCSTLCPMTVASRGLSLPGLESAASIFGRSPEPKPASMTAAPDTDFSMPSLASSAASRACRAFTSSRFDGCP